MAAVSSSTRKEVGDKPVIVRVKRKVGHSPLDAFWLEIGERPIKRPLLGLSKLSLFGSVKKEDVKLKKVLVRHLETVTDSDVIHSLFESGVNEHSCSKGKFEDRKVAFKKDNVSCFLVLILDSLYLHCYWNDSLKFLFFKKFLGLQRKEQLLTKAVQQQQTASQNARFEQIWRSRKGNKDKELHGRCNFYDVIRVDAEERPDNAPELTSLEDQKLLASFLPLLRESIPRAAEEIEADIHSSYTEEEEYVYDFYAVNEEMDVSEEDSSELQFPLVSVIVEEEKEFWDGPDESDYDSDDSNAEDHPRNEYPEVTSEDEEEEEDEEGEEEDDEESSGRHVRMVVEEDEFFGYAEDVNGSGDSDEKFVYF